MKKLDHNGRCNFLLFILYLSQILNISPAVIYSEGLIIGGFLRFEFEGLYLRGIILDYLFLKESWPKNVYVVIDRQRSIIVDVAF